MTAIAPRGALILVVEDEMLIASLLEAELKRAGYRVLGPVATLLDARHLIDACRPDFALIDYRLGTSTSESLLCALREYAVPILVLTGYKHSHLPPAYADCPVLEKPFRVPSLLEAIGKLAG